MTSSDPSFLIKSIKGKHLRPIGTYVDDTISAGSTQLANDYSGIEERFDEKSRKYDNFKFSGMQVETLPN